MTAAEMIARKNIAYYGKAKPEGLTLIDFENTEAGDLVIVHSRGGWRLAVVESVGRTNVTVVYTTEGALAESRRIYDHYMALDLDAVWKSTYRAEGKNYDYLARAERLDWERSDEARQNDNKRVAGITREQYAAERADRERARLADEQDKAREGGPEQYANYSRKSVKATEAYAPSR